MDIPSLVIRLMPCVSPRCLIRLSDEVIVLAVGVGGSADFSGW